MKESIDFYDIYDYYYPPFWQSGWFKITSVIVIIALLAGIIAYISYKRRNKRLPPWDWAKQELLRYQPALLKNKQEFKVFYFHLTQTLKTYFYKRYSWPTNTLTDDEFVTFMHRNSDHEISTTIKNICDGATWIKFANQDALKTQAEQDVQAALRIIEKTRDHA